MKNHFFSAFGVIISWLALAVWLEAAPARAVDPGAAAFIATLQSSALPKEKSEACRQLARVGGVEAIAPLAALLDDPLLSDMARYALERIPEVSVNAELRAALGRTQGRQLAGVITSLGVRKDADATPLLAALLNASEAEVAEAAALALGSIGGADAIQALLRQLERSDAASQRLAVAEGLLRGAEARWAAGDRSEARKIYQALTESPLPPSAQMAAIRGAIVHGGRAGRRLLAASLGDPGEVVFQAAIRASLELRSSATATALIRALPELPFERQCLVLRALGDLGLPEAIRPLGRLAEIGWGSEARVEALRALARIGSPGALPVFCSLLADADAPVAEAAQAALGAAPGKEADALVLQLLNSDDPRIKLAAIELTGRRRIYEANPRLLREAGAGSDEIRLAALRKLGELGGEGEFKVLLERLVQPAGQDLEATEAAVTAIALRGASTPYVLPLAAALGRGAPEIQAALLHILAALGGPEALRAVTYAARQGEKSARSAAVRALADWSSPDAAPALLALVRDAGDAPERAICLRGYLRIAGQGELGDAARLRMVKEAADLVRDTEERKLLLGMLGGIGSADALDYVMMRVEDEPVRAETRAAIVSISRKLLAGPAARQHASAVVQALEKSGAAASEADLLAAAKKLAGGAN